MFKDCKTYLSKYDYLMKKYSTTSITIFESEILKLLDNFSKNEFNEYLESLACGYITNLKEFYNKGFSINVFYALFKTYPYFMYQIGYYKTVKQQFEFIDKLNKLDEKYKITIQQYSINIKIIIKHLETYYSSYSTNSCVTNFNNFIGITFKTTNLKYQQLPKNLFVIHCGFNNECDNLIYSNIKNITENFLTEDIAKRQTHIHIKTLKTNKCWELIENDKCIADSLELNSKDLNEFEFKLPNTKNIYSIVICYDNSKKIDECYYSITEKSFSIDELNILINGGMLYQLNQATLKLYMSKLFYQRMNMIDTNEREDEEMSRTKILKSKLAQVIVNCYDPDYLKCIDKTCSVLHDKYLYEYLHILVNCVNQDGKLDIIKYKRHLENFYFLIN